MRSNLQISPLIKALTWLTWLITSLFVLLIASTGYFKYLQIEADALKLAHVKVIDNDTLSLKTLVDVTSLEKILAAPEKYHNHSVQVKGYLNLEFEGDAIYWHKADYSNHLFENGCWVSFSDSLLREKQVADYSGRFVVIKGVFDAAQHGHGSLFAGAITDICCLNSLQKTVK